MRNIPAQAVFVLFFGIFQIHAHALDKRETAVSRGGAVEFASQEGERPAIEWFKQETGISPKYVEHESGVMGLSWVHFFAMVFLILSFFLALLALYLRYRRTKELLNLILKEGPQNDREG
jgi:hypothetical protein